MAENTNSLRAHNKPTICSRRQDGLQGGQDTSGAWRRAASFAETIARALEDCMLMGFPCERIADPQSAHVRLASLDNWQTVERAAAEQGRQVFRFIGPHAANAFGVVRTDLRRARVAGQNAAVDTLVDGGGRLAVLIERAIKAFVELDRAFLHSDVADGRMVTVQSEEAGRGVM